MSIDQPQSANFTPAGKLMYSEACTTAFYKPVALVNAYMYSHIYITAMTDVCVVYI